MIVIGGGVGGLVLGRALRDAGAEVLVADRDSRAEDTGGYRLHLDATACEILARRLPPAVYQALLASSAGPGSFQRFTFLDHRLRPLLRIPRPGDGDNLLISRIALRTLLCHGLDDVVAFGREFTHHTVHDGVVTAHFADGTTETGDVLVGADGARSRTASVLAGRPTARRLRANGLAGRTPIGGDTVVPPELRVGPAFVFGPGGTIVFLSAHDPATASVDAAACREVPPVVDRPFLLWGITTVRDLPLDARPDVHHELARYLLRDWSPVLRDLVAAADPASVTAFPYYAADPETDLVPWPAGPVTALGDAVHAMPPTGGRGAITALRDADLLAEELTRALRGETTVPLAVHAYQQRMPEYAVDAVRESLQPLRWQLRLRNPAVFQLGRLALSAGSAVRRA
ncbi:FAD-dependent oxidoreductase [Actinophytocola xanthii]|nr:FAD-dependent monooxygenase [Actinophytocola xanthii]